MIPQCDCSVLWAGGCGGVGRASMKHAKKDCRVENCAQCLWIKYGDNLQKKFTLQPGAKEPWVAARFSAGLGIGCIACAAAAHGNDRQQQHTFARFTIFACTGSHLWRHTRTKQHQDAVVKYVGESATQPRLMPLDAVAACWESMQKGNSSREKSCASDRKTLLRWCVSEAILEWHREFLKEARSIVLCRDARAARLMVRFRAATDDLRCRAGVLGVAKHYEVEGLGSDGIVKATAQILRDFCTRFADAPRGTRLPKPAMDTILEAHIRNHLEIMVTDAASDELLACNQGRGRREMITEPETLLTPNLVFVARDHAHAARRTGERELASANWREPFMGWVGCVGGGGK